MSRKRLFAAILGLTISCAALDAHAEYNANINGSVLDIIVYADSDRVYFSLYNQPPSHPVCNPGLFVISESLSAERRRVILDRLFQAKRLGEVITVGYDAVGNCAEGGFLRVHRIG